jgi:hypothetical protein
MYCKRELYGTGGGTTLSRHRAERIVDEMGLVDLYTQSK